MSAQFFIGLLLGYFASPKIPSVLTDPLKGGFPGGLPDPRTGIPPGPWDDLPGPWNPKNPHTEQPKQEPKKQKPLSVWPVLNTGWGIPIPAKTEDRTPPGIVVDIDPTGGGLPFKEPVTTMIPQATSYTIRSGDYPSGLSQRKTGDAGRWRELLTANPDMTTYTDSNGATQIRPWQVGQIIVLPAGWAA